MKYARTYYSKYSSTVKLSGTYPLKHKFYDKLDRHCLFVAEQKSFISRPCKVNCCNLLHRSFNTVNICKSLEPRCPEQCRRSNRAPFRVHFRSLSKTGYGEGVCLRFVSELEKGYGIRSRKFFSGNLTAFYEVYFYLPNNKLVTVPITMVTAQPIAQYHK